MCSAYGIALVRTELASTPQEALEAATEIGLPVVLKSDAPAVSHRAAADAVRLGLDSGPAIEAAYRSIAANVRAHDESAALEGLLVQSQVAGAEAIVGVTTEPGFGPLVTVGTGGRLVEVLGDRSTRLAPLSIAEAEEMLAETRLPDLLAAEGNEGGIGELRELLVRVSELASETTVVELDFNPVMVREDGVTIVDALVRTDSTDGAGGDGGALGDTVD